LARSKWSILLRISKVGCPYIYEIIQVGEELLLIDKYRGYIFYTMRRGVNNGYNRCEGSGYDYYAMDK
jgi:hypothetical protein